MKRLNKVLPNICNIATTTKSKQSKSFDGSQKKDGAMNTQNSKQLSTINPTENKIKTLQQSTTCLSLSLRQLLSDNTRKWGEFAVRKTFLFELPSLSSEAIDSLKQEQIRLHACLIPINRKTAAVYLAKLRTRYPTQFMSVDISKNLINEDLEDIAEYPEYLVEYACKAWRNNPDNEWAPKSVAQLMKCVKGKHRTMKRELERIGTLLKRTE